MGPKNRIATQNCRQKIVEIFAGWPAERNAYSFSNIVVVVVVVVVERTD